MKTILNYIKENSSIENILNVKPKTFNGLKKITIKYFNQKTDIKSNDEWIDSIGDDDNEISLSEAVKIYFYNVPRIPYKYLIVGRKSNNEIVFQIKTPGSLGPSHFGVKYYDGDSSKIFGIENPYKLGTNFLEWLKSNDDELNNLFFNK